jgi:hypothetical protein
MNAAELARALADNILALAPDLLHGGHCEGHEWRAGSVAGEAGSSLAVHLSGQKSGVWSDFATGEAGDALDLVCATLGVDMGEAMAWARRWLGIDDGAAALPIRSLSTPKAIELEQDQPDRWRHPWGGARPIALSLAEAYLAVRSLRFNDPDGRVLRFAPRRARKNPVDNQLEHRPALLAALSDARTGKQRGLINIYLRADGSDRIRDKKGKTVTSRTQGAAVMLSNFDEPTAGLILCEGVETGIALLQSEMRPVWACGGAGTLATLPVLGGIEALTIAADADEPGQRAAEALAERWRQAGREVSIVAPPAGDWAEPQS